MSQQVSFNPHPNFNPHKNTNPNASFNRHVSAQSFSQQLGKARMQFHKGSSPQPSEPQIRYDANGIPFLEDVCTKIDRFSMTAQPVSMMDEANKLLEAGDYKGYVEALAWMGLKPRPLPLIAQEFDLEYTVNSLTADIHPAFTEYVNGVPVQADPLGKLKAAVTAKLGQTVQMQFVTCNLYAINSKLSELAEIAKQADYSGMSDAQKYKAIYDRYAEAFGPDFQNMMPFMYAGSPEDDPKKIITQFKKELWDAIGYDNDKVAAACKAAQYGNMSDSEVRAAIAAKYPPMNQITLREFKLLVNELSIAGVDGGLQNVMYRAQETSGYSDFVNGVPGLHALIMENHLLDKPLDISWLSDAYKTMSNAMGKTPYNDVGTSDAVMRELFGVGLSNSGNTAIYRAPGTVSYSTLVKQAASIYENWTKSDYENFLREQHEIERQQWLKDNEQQVKIYEAWLTWGVHIKPHYDPSNAISGIAGGEQGESI